MAVLPTELNSFRLPPSSGRLCMPITGATIEAMRLQSAALLPEFPFQELRLDYLTNPQEAMPQLRALCETHAGAFFLATCRPARSGGHLQGAGAEELALLLQAAGAGCALVDLSLETAEELGPDALDQLRRHGASVLLSYHDFEGTGDLGAVLDRMRLFRPDMYKIVPTAHSLGDSLTTLHLLGRAAQEAAPLLAIAMGESGLLTRVLGPSHGSAFTFAAATDVEATAPGQLTARTLTDLYRAPAISRSTRIYGVAGDPIRTSLSPLMHNTALRHAGLDAVYLPLKTRSAEDLLRAAHQLPLSGFSITMPLKQAILPWLDWIDPLAQRIGAVNTVRRTPDGKLHGYNTDVAGIIVPLERHLSLGGAKILVLGAGGAARAAVFGCLDRGAHVSVANRTPETAQALAQEAGALPISRSDLTRENFDVIIHATPAGMRGSALTLPCGEEELRASLVFDLVYNPIETPLLALARSQGRKTIAGIEMFVHQGARQFEIWTEQLAPADLMYQAVWQSLMATAAS